MKTYNTKEKDIIKKWYIIDATDKVLGRLSTKVAGLLIGKGKTIYAPNLEIGDHVVIINAAKVKLTGKKLIQKTSFSYSGYPGGARFLKYDRLMVEKPDWVVKKAIKGMLPHTKLGDKMLTRLRVYKGSEHGQASQKLERIEL